MRLDHMQLDHMQLDHMRLDHMQLDHMRLDHMRLDSTTCDSTTCDSTTCDSTTCDSTSNCSNETTKADADTRRAVVPRLARRWRGRRCEWCRRRLIIGHAIRAGASPGRRRHDPTTTGPGECGRCFEAQDTMACDAAIRKTLTRTWFGMSHTDTISSIVLLYTDCLEYAGDSRHNVWNKRMVTLHIKDSIPGMRVIRDTYKNSGTYDELETMIKKFCALLG